MQDDIQESAYHQLKAERIRQTLRGLEEAAAAKRAEIQAAEELVMGKQAAVVAALKPHLHASKLDSEINSMYGTERDVDRALHRMAAGAVYGTEDTSGNRVIDDVLGHRLLEHRELQVFKSRKPLTPHNLVPCISVLLDASK